MPFCACSSAKLANCTRNERGRKWRQRTTTSDPTSSPSGEGMHSERELSLRKQPSLQQTVSASELGPNETHLHKHTHTIYAYKIQEAPPPHMALRQHSAPPTPLSISPVWKHFKQTCTSLRYRKGNLQDVLSSIPAGLIRIVLNSQCHAF